MKRLIIFPIVFFLTLSFSHASEYVLDTSHSHVGFSIKHLMISNVKGNFNSYEAEIDFDAQTKTFNALSAIIEAKSINTENEKRDKHLRSADFFDVEKFDTITFEGTKISKDKIIGQLTIKGITKEIELKPTINGIIKYKGDTRIGFSLEGVINRKDFGLTWNKALETGGVLVGDEVKLLIDIQAIEL